MKIAQKEETKNIKPFSNYFKEMLISRGVVNIEDWKEYYYPTKKNILNPLLLDGIVEAYSILLKNIDKKIGILVDSDADGFSSAAMLLNYLLRINKNLNYITFFHAEKQHGLKDSVNYFISQRCDLVIVPDAGTNDLKEQEKLYLNSIDLIILDHHEKEHEINQKNGFAIVNPQIDNYPNKGLSGGGVVFKFLQYLDTVFNVEYSDDYYDLAAFSIIGDMLNITTLENRYLITRGLKNIKNPFLKSAISKQSFLIGEELAPHGVSFYITPLINSMIRFGEQENKTKLFLSLLDNDGKQIINQKYQSLSEVMVEECIKTKNKQDSVTKKCFSKAIKELEEKGLLNNEIIIYQKILKNEEEKAINGLIAMNLASELNKPVLYLIKTSSGLQGSCRNPDGHPIKDFKEYLKESGFVEYAQGHANAFGVSIKEENIEKLIDKSNSDIKNISINNIHYVDFIRKQDDYDIDTLIENLAANDDLYGIGNKVPEIALTLKICANDIKIKGNYLDTVGIKCDGYSLVKFKDKEFAELIDTCQLGEITIIGTPSLNYWKDNIIKQIIIKDFELKIIDKKLSEEEFFII